MDMVGGGFFQKFSQISLKGLLKGWSSSALSIIPYFPVEEAEAWIDQNHTEATYLSSGSTATISTAPETWSQAPEIIIVGHSWIICFNFLAIHS